MQVRLSNMARVFGADGVTDATAIEMRVRKAQEERHAAHEDRNAARASSPPPSARPNRCARCLMTTRATCTFRWDAPLLAP